LLEPTTLAILVIVAFLTSILSAIVGMAGGIVLLTVMLLFFDPLEAIPIHGAVQLISNGTRTWIQRVHVERGIVWRYGLLLVPAGIAGLWIAQALDPPITRMLIGVFVLFATWAPNLLLLGAHPEAADRNTRFIALGGVVGLIQMTIGATGPLIAPFFLNLGLARQALVGTKAACQALGHLAKILVFGTAGFAFAAFAAPLLWLAGAVVVGTWIGSRILGRVSETLFVRLYKTVLTLIALRLLLVELWTLLGA
jgi:uncharacterized membrane protein YfcA